MPKHAAIDEQTLMAAKNDDIRAFEAIVSRFERPIYTFIYRMVSDRFEAQDLTQETFVKLYRNIGRYDPDRNFSSWLFTIAVRTVYEWLRKKRRQNHLFILDDEDNPTEVADSRTDYQQINNRLDIQQALARLRPDYRLVILLHYWQDCTYVEISNLLEVPLNTVKTFLNRAKRHLWRELAEG